MLAHLGTDVLAAVSYGAQFLFLAQSILLAIGIACVAMMSRAIGAGEPARARRVLATFLLLGGATGLGLMTLGTAAPRVLLALVDADPDVAGLAAPYVRILFVAALFFGFSTMHEAGYRASGNTRLPLLVVWLVVVAKLSGNALLIGGAFGLPALGLVGAASATLAAYVLGLSLYLWLARRTDLKESAVLRLSAGDWTGLGRLIPEALRLSAPSVLERIVMQSATMVYFWALADYGAPAIAAYGVGLRLLSFSWIPAMGYAVAVATLVGQALGSGQREVARLVARRTLLLSTLTAVLLAILYLGGRSRLVGWFTDEAAVITMLLPFLVVMSFAQPLIAMNFTFGGVLRGAGDTITPLKASAAGTWLVRVPGALLLGRLLHTDVLWVFALLAVDHGLRVLLVARAYARGAWAERLGAAVVR
jgi:putative MATE family efflux protein